VNKWLTVLMVAICGIQHCNMGSADPIYPAAIYPAKGTSSFVADFDGSGREDWVSFSPGQCAETSPPEVATKPKLYITRQDTDGLLQQDSEEIDLDITCNSPGQVLNGAVVVGDFDGDGHVDIAAVMYSTLYVWKGLGNDKFAAPTTLDEGIPLGIQVTDWFEDGHKEIVLSGTDYSHPPAQQSYLYLIKMNSDGTLTQLRNSPIAFVGGVFDLRGDGVQDIVTPIPAPYATASVTGGLAIQRDTGTGFSSPESYGGLLFTAGHMAVADLNGDGLTDIVLSGGLASIEVFFQNPDGTFTQVATPSTDTNPSSISIGDMDGDGLPDIIVGNDGFTQFDYIRQSSVGVFASPAAYFVPGVGYSSVDVVVADMNSDGKPDVIEPEAGDIWYNRAGNVPTIDASVSLKATPNPTIIGGTATFIATVSNSGTAPMKSGTLLFTVPSLTEIHDVSAGCTLSNSGTYSPGIAVRHLLTCNVGKVIAGGHIDFKVTGKILSETNPYVEWVPDYRDDSFSEIDPYGVDVRLDNNDFTLNVGRREPSRRQGNGSGSNTGSGNTPPATGGGGGTGVPDLLTLLLLAISARFRMSNTAVTQNTSAHLRLS